MDNVDNLHASNILSSTELVDNMFGQIPNESKEETMYCPAAAAKQSSTVGFIHNDFILSNLRKYCSEEQKCLSLDDALPRSQGILCEVPSDGLKPSCYEDIQSEVIKCVDNSHDYCLQQEDELDYMFMAIMDVKNEKFLVHKLV